MQYALAAFGLAAIAAAKPMPQGSSSQYKAPSSPSPPGCVMSVDGPFAITTVNVSQSTHMKREDISKRQASGLVATLQNGVMHDSGNYIADIVANHQFQFDPEPQSGYIYAAGWSLCPNNTIALGGSTIFYSCVSGNFANIYDQSQGQQCSQVFLSAMKQGGSSSSAASSAVSQTSDAQPQAATSAGASSMVSQISDKQPQAPTSAGASSKVSQISDHQPQAPTSAMMSMVSQISDHQPQAPTSVAGVTQISDHQPQAPTSVSGVTQISDHQPQAPTSVSGVSQISDHQPQAATSVAGVTQISDHQPQAATSVAGVSQISDHQPQAATSAANYTAMVSPAAYTAGAAVHKPEVLALAAGAVALLF